MAVRFLPAKQLLHSPKGSAADEITTPTLAMGVETVTMPYINCHQLHDPWIWLCKLDGQIQSFSQSPSLLKVGVFSKSMVSKISAKNVKAEVNMSINYTW